MMAQSSKWLGGALCLAMASGFGTASAAAAGPAMFIPAGTVADAPAGFLELCRRDHALCRAGIPDRLGAAVPTEPMRTAAAPVPLPVVGAALPDTSIIGTAALGLHGQGHDRRVGRAAPVIAPGSLDDATLIRLVNAQVNRQIVPTPDIASHGVYEEWDRPGRIGRPPGDCEDYAIEKRVRLLEAGFAADRMFFAVAYRSNFGLHTVLIARMPDGDFVLDSAVGTVERWSKARYTWLRVQSPTDPMRWTTVAAS
jgi:predicted transglutaminase-like cysteine proteinase